MKIAFAVRHWRLLLVLFLAARCWAQQPVFVATEINAKSEFPACAVIDVNKDGKLDIVSGGYWYEAPNWKQHFLREVEVIRGRFDDYSNLEIDVNADGWTDILSSTTAASRCSGWSIPARRSSPTPKRPGSST
jgi:hypothetical protein